MQHEARRVLHLRPAAERRRRVGASVTSGGRCRDRLASRPPSSDRGDLLPRKFDKLLEWHPPRAWRTCPRVRIWTGGLSNRSRSGGNLSIHNEKVGVFIPGHAGCSSMYSVRACDERNDRSINHLEDAKGPPATTVRPRQLGEHVGGIPVWDKRVRRLLFLLFEVGPDVHGSPGRA
jgi:hypothetical protein